ncbi:MAG: ribosome-associated translation inhibitor RaiA [Elusimicrobia bacterium]|nr:ribosome-associated translation inhibitor RaiA [Elusimicrobiota bacterium]
MQLNITARHLDLTPALSDYLQRKVEKAQRYFDAIIWAQAILTVEKHRQIAEIVVHTPGNTFRTVGESADLYSAIDLAVHKLDLHLSRVKDKKKNHRKKADPRELAKMKSSLDSLGLSPSHFPSESFTEISPKKIIKTERVSLKTISVNEAIQELSADSLPLLPFINERTNRLNIVYPKGRAGYGLLEAEE